MGTSSSSRGLVGGLEDGGFHRDHLATGLIEPGDSFYSSICSSMLNCTVGGCALESPRTRLFLRGCFAKDGLRSHRVPTVDEFKKAEVVGDKAPLARHP